MTDKFLVIIPNIMPTTEIALRTISQIIPEDRLRVITQKQVRLEDIFSGEYKLMFMRQHEPYLYPLINLIIEQKIPYLYYIDDNFWEIPGDTPIARCYQNKLARKTINVFVQNAFYVITPSLHLSNYIKQFTNHVTNINAAFDFDIIKDVKQVPKSSAIKLLYAGTPYRESDFSFVIAAIKRIVNEYDGKVEVYFKGFIPASLKSTQWIHFDEKFYPYAEHIRAQYAMNYDIGIAPISDTLFNRAKSYLKFREYSACGMAGVYTDIPPYADCVKHMDTGILTPNTEEGWYQAIKLLVNDKALREQIIANAHNDVINHHTHAVMAPLWDNMIESVPAHTNKPIPSAIQRLIIKLKGHLLDSRYKLQRTIDYVRHDGMSFTLKKVMKTLSP